MKPRNKLDDRILEALEREPDFALDAEFSDRIMKHIHEKEAKKEWSVFWLTALGMAGFTALAILCLFLFLGSEIARYTQLSLWAAMAGMVFFLIQWLDRRFVRQKVSGLQ